MAEDEKNLPFEMALAMREVRLYWRPGREPLSLDDKQRLAEMILAGLKQSHISLTVVRSAPPHSGRGTGEFMR